MIACCRIAGLQKKKKKKTAKIKISGVRINPFAGLESEQQQEQQELPSEMHNQSSQSEPQHRETEPQQDMKLKHQQTEPEPEQEVAFEQQETVMQKERNQSEIEQLRGVGDTTSDLEQGLHEPEGNHHQQQPQQQRQEDENAGVAIADESEQPTEQSQPETARESTTSVTACPSHAQVAASGYCECLPGYEVDSLGESCVLSDEMSTTTEATARVEIAPPFDVSTSPNHAGSMRT